MKKLAIFLAILLTINCVSADYLVKTEEKIAGEKISENLYLVKEIPKSNNVYVVEDNVMELNNPYYDRQWYMHSTGQCINPTFCTIYATPDVDIDANEAHQITKGSGIIAVIDSGATNHEDLNLWINENEILDGIDNDNNGYIDDISGWNFYNNNNDVTDNYNHGTAVAGIISAKDNNIGIKGICPDCKVMVIKVTDTKYVSTARVIQAIDYAKQNGATIISMSFSTSTPNIALQEAIQNSRALVIASAGNQGSTSQRYPAAYDEVIGVAASDYKDKRAIFSSTESSNYGSWIDITAPGDAIYTTDNAGGYFFFRGTSASAPIVAGVAALIKSENPQMTNQQIKEKLLNTAQPMNSIEYSQGMMGSGRVNAYEAIKKIMRKKPTANIRQETSGATY